MSQKKPLYLAIGFRYDKSFAITDYSGSIVDTLLYQENSPFSKEDFPLVEDHGLGDRQLVNPKTNAFLRINASDIILRWPIKNDFDSEFKWFSEEACAFIIEEVIKPYEIKNFNRIGTMFGYEHSNVDFGSFLLNRLTEGKAKHADHFNISFGVKDTTLDGALKKNLADFVNKIIIVKPSKPGTFEVTFDFQYHFKPTLPEITDASWLLEKYFARALKELTNYFDAFVNDVLPVKKAG